MTAENRHTAMFRMPSVSLVRLPKGWSNKPARSEYNGSFIEPSIQATYNAFIYVIFDKETGLYYVGYSIRPFQNAERYAEHITDRNCVVYLRMKNPVMSVVCTAFGTLKYIRAVEKQYIIHYNHELGDKLINIIRFDGPEPRLPIINELKALIEHKPISRDDTEGYSLVWNDGGVSKRKKFKYTGERSSGAWKKAMTFIETNFNGKFIDRTTKKADVIKVVPICIHDWSGDDCITTYY